MAFLIHTKVNRFCGLQDILTGKFVPGTCFLELIQAGE